MTAPSDNREGVVPGFHAVLLNIASNGSSGGHIGLEGKSLCGIERRFPFIETREDNHGENFAPWFVMNAAWVCRKCLKSYAERASRSSP